MYKEYPIIEKAIQYIEKNFQSQPELEEIASHLNISPFHLQRTFKEWVGISPKRFLQFLTIDYARQLLQDSRSILDATFESGLSSPARMHDLFISVDAITPGEYKKLGQGLQISWGIHSSPFGPCVIAVTQRGLCFMGFYSDILNKDFMDDMKSRFPQARFVENSQETFPYFEAIFNKNASKKRLTLFLKGTNFQIKVWEALLKIPEGRVCSYSDISNIIGSPAANQAVGNAVGANHISYLIPCHRVIRNMGIIGNYHWGSARKKAMLLWESEKSAKQRKGEYTISY